VHGSIDFSLEIIEKIAFGQPFWSQRPRFNRELLIFCRVASTLAAGRNAAMPHLAGEKTWTS
jgi:hypothetical protein